MGIKIVFAVLIFGILLISGCVETTVPDTTQPRVDMVSEECGMENCHGLDITCGPNIPEVCTEMYALGDFCREYASCEIVDGKCQLVKSPEFDQCKACVDECNEFSGPEAFECEGDCRELFE